MPFKVSNFKSLFNSIADTLVPPSYSDCLSPHKNTRISYLNEYLDRLGARTVIIEKNYVDRNFIDDYCGYYARCFGDYPKKCVRLLFFSSDFDRKELEYAVISPKDAPERKRLHDSYLGFIVLRPIPGAHFGKVCLATYPPEAGKNRIFPTLKKYDAHFMGMTFSVDTIAFQEQDNVISACATSALWSAFHCVRNRSIDEVKSPFQITKNARSVYMESPAMNVLDKGLFPSQMAAAIVEEGLNPVISGFVSKSYLKALTRAYLNAGLPLILGVTLAYEDEDSARQRHSGRYTIGEHAVTVAGYRLNHLKILPFSTDGFSPSGSTPDLYLMSSAIDKFYVHDDQVGPFSSMEDRHEYWQRLETRWNCYEKDPDKIDASVNTIIIPCFDKIRIRFPRILNFIDSCNIWLGEVWEEAGYDLIWDPRIFCLNDFKEKVAEGEIYPDSDSGIRLRLLSMSMPRYIWVVDVFASDKKTHDQEILMSYIFDATDMDSGDYLLCTIHHDADSYEVCKRLIESCDKRETDYFIERQHVNHNVFEKLFNSYEKGDTAKLLLADSDIDKLSIS